VHRGNDAHHWVKIEPDSRLAEILGAKEAKVNSNHHQAVKDVGRGLKVVARSNDGVVEALEKAEGGFGLFVQWHPESMTGDMAHRNAIFGELVRQAQDPEQSRGKAHKGQKAIGW
jgi:putative glutamine amidotransferase